MTCVVPPDLPLVASPDRRRLLSVIDEDDASEADSDVAADLNASDDVIADSGGAESPVFTFPPDTASGRRTSSGSGRVKALISVHEDKANEVRQGVVASPLSPTHARSPGANPLSPTHRPSTTHPTSHTSRQAGTNQKSQMNAKPVSCTKVPTTDGPSTTSQTSKNKEITSGLKRPPEKQSIANSPKPSPDKQTSLKSSQDKRSRGQPVTTDASPKSSLKSPTQPNPSTRNQSPRQTAPTTKPLPRHKTPSNPIPGSPKPGTSPCPSPTPANESRSKGRGQTNKGQTAAMTSYGKTSSKQKTGSPSPSTLGVAQTTGRPSSSAGQRGRTAALARADQGLGSPRGSGPRKVQGNLGLAKGDNKRSGVVDVGVGKDGIDGGEVEGEGVGGGREKGSERFIDSGETGGTSVLEAGEGGGSGRDGKGIALDGSAHADDRKDEKKVFYSDEEDGQEDKKTGSPTTKLSSSSNFVPETVDNECILAPDSDSITTVNTINKNNNATTTNNNIIGYKKGTITNNNSNTYTKIKATTTNKTSTMSKLSPNLTRPEFKLSSPRFSRKYSQSKLGSLYYPSKPILDLDQHDSISEESELESELDSSTSPNSINVFTNGNSIPTICLSPSDLQQVRDTAHRLCLSTRRPSTLLWRKQHMDAPPGTPSATQESGCDNTDQRLTSERKQRINAALDWLRAELQEMRTQDQALAKQLLTIRHDIHQLKLSRSRQEHEDLLDDFQTELEELHELHELAHHVDQPGLCGNPFRHVGVTRLNMAARRFSAC